MAINYFIGRSQQSLEADLANAQEDLAAGKSVMDASSGDVSKRESMMGSIEKRIRLILQALTVINPTLYPPSQTMPTREFRVAFGPADQGISSNQA